MTVTLGVLVSERRYGRMRSGELPNWLERALYCERALGPQMLITTPLRVDLRAWQIQGITAEPTGWRETTSHPPRVYLNYLVRPIIHEARALRQINGDQRVLVMNETNRWNRGMVYAMLRSVPGLHECVPETMAYPSGLVGRKSGAPVLVAPSRLPLRDAAFLIEDADVRRVRYTNLREGSAGLLLRADLANGPDRLPKNLRWVTQLPGLPVGPDAPVEWRLYYQRQTDLSWGISGAVAKRDVLRGRRRERSWTLDAGLALTYGTAAPEAKRCLLQSADRVMEVLSLFIPGIAHCALDFWMDRDMQPSLVDLTGHYRTDWLRSAGQLEAYGRVTIQPIRLASALALRGVVRLDVGIAEARRQAWH